MATIPTDARAITTAWLTDALLAGGVIAPGTTVTALSAETLPAGVGFMGEVARLRPRYDGAGGPATVIAKIPTQDVYVRGLLGPARVFERGARFYLELAPTLDVVADALYVAADFDTDDYVLLLPDLGHLRMGDQAAGASVDDAAVALRALARLHARFWRSPALDDLTWMPPINGEGMRIGREVYHVFAPRLPRRLRPRRRRAPPRPDPPLRRQRLPAPRPHVRHADDRGPLRLPPRQPVLRRRRDGADDRLPGVEQGRRRLRRRVLRQPEPGDRRAARLDEDELLRAYHDELVAGGVADYALDQFREDYRVGVLYGWIVPVYAVGTLDSSSERARALWTEVVERSQAAMSDHHVADLLTV